ncbi:MAG TPA: HAMP domain-containing sensor histidine kinase [Xanthomonadaceae bacterium]|nr:HAMP domain-containing sensor histidine kinase [Xanthomonadaceae bacterium]
MRRRILLAVLGYVVLLSLAVLGHGITVNEGAERLVWESLLDSEIDHYLRRSRAEPGYDWRDSGSMRLFDPARGLQPPAALAGLEEGVHDEVVVDGRQHVVLVREVDGRRLVLALDIDALEASERRLGWTVALSALVLLALLGIAVAWGVDRLLRPLDEMARQIAGLRPELHHQRITMPPGATAELVVIASALDSYLDRQEQFVERERAFIDSASHELRTPVSVIAGATELALDHDGVPDPVRRQLVRIGKTANDVEQLVSLLLVLAKDPARLVASSDRIQLDQLLPEVVDDHLHLAVGKDLEVTMGPVAPCDIVAPLPIVQAAIGNLLRNAIEHSDRGRIVVSLQPDATVVIDDPGHAMTPEEVSALYARVARGAGRQGGGIGLELIARLCEHLGWRLAFGPGIGDGTRTTLALGDPA